MGCGGSNANDSSEPTKKPSKKNPKVSDKVSKGTCVLKFTDNEKIDLKDMNPLSTVWIFGNPSNPVILQFDLKDKETREAPQNCKKIEHSDSDFKFRYNATYLRL